MLLQTYLLKTDVFTKETRHGTGAKMEQPPNRSIFDPVPCLLFFVKWWFSNLCLFFWSPCPVPSLLGKIASFHRPPPGGATLGGGTPLRGATPPQQHRPTRVKLFPRGVDPPAPENENLTTPAPPKILEEENNYEKNSDPECF